MADENLDVDPDTVTSCADCDANQLPVADETLADLPKVMDADIIVANPVDNTVPTKFAPVIPPVKGDYTLYGLAIKWADNPGANLSSVTNACHAAASIYRDLSGGLLNFKVVTKNVLTNLNHNGKNLAAAEKAAKASVGNPQTPHVYAIFNNKAQSFSHGSGDTAHLYGTLTRDVCHEVGHCRPTGLGHSGKYDANGKLLPYDDGTSFMGRFSSSKLTAPQLYLLGWLGEKKVAQYDFGDAPTDFNIQNLFGDTDNDNLQMVLIPNGTQRPIYLSMPQVNGKALLAIHLSSGRGSQRVTVFANKASYAGLLFEKIADGGNFVTVRISAAT